MLGVQSTVSVDEDDDDDDSPSTPSIPQRPESGSTSCKLALHRGLHPIVQ